MQIQRNIKQIHIVWSNIYQSSTMKIGVNFSWPLKALFLYDITSRDTIEYSMKTKERYGPNMDLTLAWRDVSEGHKAAIAELCQYVSPIVGTIIRYCWWREVDDVDIEGIFVDIGYMVLNF